MDGAHFPPFLYHLVDGLFESYPISDKTLRIEKLHLRYIDGFDKSFGFERYSDFANTMLGINCQMPDNFIERSVKEDSQSTYLFEYRFANSSPVGSHGKIKLAPGRMNNNNAMVMEFYCESTFPGNSAVKSANMKNWFEEAHQCLHLQFETLATPELKDIMGEKKKVG